ncbi:hypothetical protein [Paenibacillus agilis]|uniref:HTH LytTR-type domain-containing protein n=1 Tax=Paenibacillus agilis TaxID=3020863 RepID=A0A559IZM6_9BACL|nr:hypothetical protein [Paenibacillus agilis]TVX93072.1 hypothetical protein FPZ44_08365 [Paenibacillus agilis]
MHYMKSYFSVPLDEGNDDFSFTVNDLLFVQNWNPFKKVEVPRYFTKKGLYTVPLSLENCDEGLQSFELVQPWHLVNKALIAKIESENYGHMISFKSIDLKISISNAKYEIIDLVNTTEETRHVFAVEVETRKVVVLALKDVCVIELFDTKNGYRVPSFLTHLGLYEPGLTLRQCKDVFPFLTQIDSGVLANVENIKQIEITPYGQVVHFYDSEYTTSIGKTMAKRFRGIVPIIETR